ncbi:hypothetical protein E2C01_003582 [Portunus trituberculatus]|uniref:Uncharacterized protein n=1 Tax=Portunus trituberculatus TaxID=210409 RepID=A0A5B7CP62_PORTR|nr:hypothetical protein [Portunus trituberculatus]
MLELRRLNRPSSSQSIYHNVKIVLDQQEPLPTLHQWVLTIDMGNGTQTEYKVQAEDAYQKEVEFEADITYVLSSRVARVGTEYNEKVSSLRVWPGAMTEDVTVGQYQCQRNGVPCYYLSTTLPLDIPRCVINYNNVKQCDDFITDFQTIVYERLHQCVRSDGDRSHNQEFSRLMFELHERFLESDGERKYLASFSTCSIATSSIYLGYGWTDNLKVSQFALRDNVKGYWYQWAATWTAVILFTPHRETHRQESSRDLQIQGSRFQHSFCNGTG